MTGAEPPGRPPGNWVRFAGAGLELAAATGGMCAIGYLLDRKLGTTPWCLLVCAILGIVGGLYNLVRVYLQEVLRQRPRDGGGQDSRTGKSGT
jgi:F0F1-type ATP synthase assembly protein I